jgi:hypothetical protein
MELLLPILLLVGLFLAVDLLWSPPSWLREVAGAGQRQVRPADAAPAADAGVSLEWDAFSLPFIRRRLHVVADELDRLEHDPGIFARAFHTTAARSAYESLQSDESRLTALPCLELDDNVVGPPAPLREELEL